MVYTGGPKKPVRQSQKSVNEPEERGHRGLAGAAGSHERKAWVDEVNEQPPLSLSPSLGRPSLSLRACVRVRGERTDLKVIFYHSRPRPS